MFSLPRSFSLRSLIALTFHHLNNKEAAASVNSNADVKLTMPLIKARGLTPVLMGWKWSQFSRFLSMDISVATFPFLVLTVTSLEQFPYTVSYGSKRYNWCIQHGEASLGSWGGAGKGAREKRRMQRGFGRKLHPLWQSVGIAGSKGGQSWSEKTTYRWSWFWGIPACPPRTSPMLVLYSMLAEHFLCCSFIARIPICLVLYVSPFSPQVLRTPWGEAPAGCSSEFSASSTGWNSEHSKGSKVLVGLKSIEFSLRSKPEILKRGWQVDSIIFCV